MRAKGEGSGVEPLLMVNNFQVQSLPCQPIPQVLLVCVFFFLTFNFTLKYN